MSDGLIIQQVLYAAAKLGVADLMQDGPRSVAELARRLEVNEPALYRILRALAAHGVFEETAPRTFANTELSRFLCTGVPGSIRSIIIFRGSEFFYPPFGEILYSIQTGQSARTMLNQGLDGFEYLRKHPELASIFDGAMTNISQLASPAIAAAYDFGAWGSLMDVGGGNGVLLATILGAHPGLRGVLAEQPDVLERARQSGFFGGELAERSSFQSCDFFREVHSGCRAYLMKSVIHDWDDERAHQILVNCRRAVPDDGVLLLVELALSEGNLPSMGKLFRLNQVAPVPGDLSIIESTPI
jgi:hypothetical protein